MSDTSTSYHLIGIGGIGMSALAYLLVSQGKMVTGSDLSENGSTCQLRQLGVSIFIGHSEKHVLPSTTVVYSTDIKEENPELKQAKKIGCPLIHRSELLAQLTEKKKGLAVAGTHGKTTTSALLATVLVESGEDPSFAIGGHLPAFNRNAKEGKGPYFVFEADESDGSFLKYHPFGGIITNIDSDHLGSYGGSTEALVKAFKTFKEQVQSLEHLFWCGEDAHLSALFPSSHSYGFSPLHSWHISFVEQKNFHLFFDVKHHNHLFRSIELPLIGVHNVLNATAVFGLGLTLGISETSLRKGLLNFKGVLRRCEWKGEERGIHFFDDYAHHPTEISTTLSGLRKAIGKRRLIVIFQPHRYTRTKDCLHEFKHVFDAASYVYLTDIYAAGEPPIDGISSASILEQIKKYSTVPCSFLPRSKIVEEIPSLLQKEDVVVTLGAGDVTKIGPEILAAMKE